MKLTLKVTTADETYEVITNLAVVIAWERKFKSKASTLASNIGMEDLAFMAYESVKLSGRTYPATFDAYIKTLDGIEVISDEPANPTDGEPTHDH